MTYNYTEKELKTYYDVALEQVNKCGQIFMEGYRKSKLDAKVKDAYWDFVTVYDVQIEQTLCQSLKAAFPESIFIGEEETSSTKNKMKLTDVPTWILDPIDGTTNFMHKLPFSAISLALTINKQLVMGVVYNPAANELYSAWKANGAYLNGQRIHVSGARKINEALIATEISFIHTPEVRDKVMKRVYKLASAAAGTRCFVCAALTLSYIAKGSVDAYHIDGLKPWDAAAGAFITTEAGGVIYNSNGNEFDVMNPDFVCAATEDLAKEVLQLVREADDITNYTFT